MIYEIKVTPRKGFEDRRLFEFEEYLKEAIRMFISEGHGPGPHWTFEIRTHSPDHSRIRSEYLGKHTHPDNYDTGYEMVKKAYDEM